MTSAVLTLRQRLVLLLLLPVVVLGGLIVRQRFDARDERIQAEANRLLHETQIIAAKQQYLAARAESVLKDISLEPSVQPHSLGSHCSDWLAERMHANREFVNMGTLNPTGVVVCAAVQPKVPTSFGDRGWFRQALLSPQMIVGDVVVGKILNRPVVTLAQAIRGPQGHLDAVAFVTLDLAWLQQQVQAVGLPPDTHLGVVDSHGNVVARHPDPEHWTGRDASHLSLVQTILRHRTEGTFTAENLNGRSAVVGYTPLLKTVSGDLWLWMERPLDAVAATTRRELAQDLATVAVLACLVLALALWGGNRWLLQPMQRLSHAAGRLGAGEYGARSGLQHAPHEIGHLAQAFDSAAEKIETLVLARQAAEARLADSAQRLQLLVDHAPASLAMFDRDMRYLAVSRRWLDDYRLGDVDLIGQNHYAVFPEVPDTWRAIHRRALNGEVIRSDEDCFERQDGSTQWLRWEVRPWYSSDGAIGGVVIFSEDISARKLAEQALRDSERRFVATFEQAALGLALVAPDGRWLRVNRTLCDIVGYAPDELISKTFQDITHPDDLDSDLTLVQRMLAHEIDHYALEKRYLRKDGDVVWVRLTVALVWTADNRPDYFISAVEDVSERREVEARLRKLSMAVEQSPESILITDRAGRIEYVNPAFTAHSGYRADEVIGLRPSVLQSGKTPNGTYASLWAALLSGEPWQGEFHNRRKDGSELIESSVIAPIKQADGTVTHFVAVQADITAQKRMSAELEQYRADLESLVQQRTAQLTEAQAKAEAATQSKSAFLANMSHEIRTPMNAMLGLAYLLAQSDLPAETRDMVDKLRRSGRTLLGILNDVLDFSKIEAGSLELESAPFQLSDVLSNLSTIMATNAAGKPVELVIDPPPAELDWVQGDALRLEQVLINLTGNAIKFTQQGHVKVGLTLLSETASQVTLKFWVEDTGIGMDDATCKRIFAPFTQADSSTTRRYGGTGLGLSICQRLVRLMGGEMGLTSTLGQGSTFWFTLTLTKAVPAASDPSNAMHGLNVLIADDNAVALAALEKMATSLGWHASAFGSGDALMQHVLDHPPGTRPCDVYVLDWQMPVQDGLQVAQWLNERQQDLGAPIVIMVTAHARESLLAAPGAQWVDAVLNKPVTASALHDAVAQALRARQPGTAPREPLRSGQRRLLDLRMLVVDDSDINREVAQRIFEREGAQVFLANDGQGAVDWLRANPRGADIVLMDLQMPVLDGLNATRIIRQDPALQQLPVVALSAGVLRSQRDAALAVGMTDFIAKPLDVDAAVSVICRATGRTPVTAITAAPADTHAPAPLPGLDLARGLQVFQDAVAYQQYLRIFAQDYADAAPFVAHATPPELAPWLHKLKGAAANLGVRDVAAAASELDHVLQTNPIAVSERQRLMDALATATRSIATYAVSPRPVTKAVADSAVLRPLLDDILAALDHDNPDEAEPLLETAAKWLTEEQINGLRTAVQRFDFRLAETLVKDIAATLPTA